jgi:hypothetical protein
MDFDQLIQLIKKTQPLSERELVKISEWLKDSGVPEVQKLLRGLGEKQDDLTGLNWQELVDKLVDNHCPGLWEMHSESVPNKRTIGDQEDENED